jgi:hypothetical protein
MKINIKQFTLKTYSLDCICIQLGTTTLSSSKSIETCLKYLDRNGIKGVKNRVQEVLKDYSTVCMDSFETQHYTIFKSKKNEWTIQDKKVKNNTRWIYHKNQVVQRVYDLEVNRLEASSIDELVVAIKQLNKIFEKEIENAN